jgi:hypothetical protein
MCLLARVHQLVADGARAAAGCALVRCVALVGTALVALLIGVSNFLSRVVYDGVYDDAE